jgi:hypothetical protein
VWERKIESELKKRGITKVENTFVKYKKKKWSMVFGNNKKYNGTVEEEVVSKKLLSVVKK